MEHDTGRWMATAIATLAVLAAAAALAATPAAAQDDGLGVTQSVSTDTVSPGDTIDVEVGVEASTLSAPGLDVDLDPRWSVTVESSDGARYRDGRHQWIWSSGGDYTARYAATVPDDAAPGRYLVVAKGSAIDRSTGRRPVQVRTSPLTVSSEASSPPNASFAYTPDEPSEAENISFDAGASTAASGSIASYRWWFGDTETATGERVTHAYDGSGTFLVTLEVTDEDGNSAALQRTVSVAADEPIQAPIGPPIPVVATSPGSSVEPGTTVRFNGSGSFDEQSEITSYAWDLDGDGSFETDGPTAERNFTEAGNYTVSLRVTDESGAENTTSVPVRVGAEAPDEGGPPVVLLVAVAVLLALVAAAVYTVTRND